MVVKDDFVKALNIFCLHLCVRMTVCLHLNSIQKMFTAIQVSALKALVVLIKMMIYVTFIFLAPGLRRGNFILVILQLTSGDLFLFSRFCFLFIKFLSQSNLFQIMCIHLYVECRYPAPKYCCV